MRYVAIEKAKDNMVLAMPIYDSINRVLLATGTGILSTVGSVTAAAHNFHGND